MKIFVTGATGLIGSHFLNALHSKVPDTEVIGLKRNTNSKPRIRLIKEPKWLLRKLDKIQSSDLKNVSILVHLAAHSMYPPYDTLEKCIYWNLTTPLNLFRLANENGVKRIIVAGSCFEYGTSGESYDKIPTTAALIPMNTYATSKAAASIVFAEFARQNSVEIIYNRFFHVFGEGEAPDRFWPALKYAAQSGDDFPMTRGEQIRDFTPVEIIAQQLIDDCLNVKLIDNNFSIRNIGTGNPRSLKDFAEYWWQHWRAKGKLKFGELEYRKDEVMRFVPEIL